MSLATGKELELVVRIRNNRLKEYREALGLSTKQVAEKVGISYGSYITLEGMNEHPLGANGMPRQPALKICDFHGVDFTELFPDAVLAATNNKFVRKIDGPELLSLTSPEVARLALPAGSDDAAEESSLRDQIKAALHTLTTREAAVLTKRFGLDGNDPRTLEETANELGPSPVTGHIVSRCLVRIIEARALRKLRHPSLARKLKDYYGDSQQPWERTRDEKEARKRQTAHELFLRGKPIRCRRHGLVNRFLTTLHAESLAQGGRAICPLPHGYRVCAYPLKVGSRWDVAPRTAPHDRAPFETHTP